MFFLIFLNLIPIAIASTLLEDWVEDDSTFKVGDNYFYVKYIESNNNLISIFGINYLLKITKSIIFEAKKDTP